MKEGFTQVARTKKGGILRRIVKYFLGFIIAMIIGLIINNRLCVLKYNKLDTTADVSFLTTVMSFYFAIMSLLQGGVSSVIMKV